jgi:predicted AAA+ superfamily ATPase
MLVENSMLTISDDEIYDGMRIENSWWAGNAQVDAIIGFPERSYLSTFKEIVCQRSVHRSVILLGPRRVGKTVMILQTIGALLQRGEKGDHIVYLSADRPLYSQKRLEELVRLHLDRINGSAEEQWWFFFDEIQYVSDWERELKSLTDLYRNIRFVASGSAAAALRRKSRESGAGRFTDFLLPALTFDEFIRFQSSEDAPSSLLARYVEGETSAQKGIRAQDVAYLNVLFERYLSYGGYPEAVLNRQVQQGMNRFVREDIIDKVLLRDLPSLYGISDTRELNRLFSTLCYNTAQEVSLEKLSQTGAIAKNTLKRYLEYLEAAFLIRTCERIDSNARAFQRQTSFKVYLTNPSLRAALFRPILQDDENFGYLAETGVLSQWFHDPDISELHYARWQNGELDIVHLGLAEQFPTWFVEVKWTDRFIERFHELKAVHEFCRQHGRTLKSGIITTRSQFRDTSSGDVPIRMMPTAVYAWLVGRNVQASFDDRQLSLFE